MTKAAVVFVVLAAFTYLQVRRLVDRRRRLGHAELPPHMPVTAGVVAAAVLALVIWFIPPMRVQLEFLIAAPLAAGLGMAAGIHRSRA